MFSQGICFIVETSDKLEVTDGHISIEMIGSSLELSEGLFVFLEEYFVKEVFEKGHPLLKISYVKGKVLNH